MDLKTFILAVLAGSFGVGPFVYWLFDQVPALVNIAAEQKRYLVFLVAAALGIVAWLVAYGLGYVVTPQSGILEAILNQGFSTGMVAFASSTIIHGVRDLGSPSAETEDAEDI